MRSELRSDFGMPTQLVKKATIYPQKHRSGNVTWIVNVGKQINGKNDLRRYEIKEEAESFRDEWNLKLANQNLSGLQDLNSISRHEILAAVQKLELVDATLPEAVDFFLKFARPSKGKIQVDEAIELFLAAKTGNDLSEAYLEGAEKTFLNPFARYFKDRIVSDISSEEIEAYIKSHTKWGSTTIRSHQNYLSTFYNFLIKKGRAKLNPIAKLEKPQRKQDAAKLLTVEQAQTLLQFAFDEDCKKECAAMTLVFFCGVRVDEVARLTWASVDLEKMLLRLEAEITKKARRRVNGIPQNALHWLTLCKGSGKIAPADYDQRMKRLRKKSGVKYPQNGMRHSFCGYHLAMFGDAAKTALLLGHPNPTLLYSTYHEVTTKEEAEKFWAIVPKSVAEKAKADAEARDNEEREAAEAQSNCGEAIKNEHREWQPIYNETKPTINYGELE